MTQDQARPSARQLLRAAIAAAGGQTAVAQEVGLTPSAVARWVERTKVPSEHIQTLCRMGNFTVSTSALIEALGRQVD